MQKNSLTFWRKPDSEFRLEVQQWLVTTSISEQFVEHPRSIAMFWNYLKRVGFTAIIRKIRSRLLETERNLKIAGLGLGIVIDAPNYSKILPGTSVIFFAYNHTIKISIISLDAFFVFPLNGVITNDSNELLGNNRIHIPDLLSKYIGWSPFSGIPVDALLVKNQLEKISQKLPNLQFKTVNHENIIFSESYEISPDEHSSKNAPNAKKPTAVLFGLGHYAKTQILPNIKPFVALRRVHEIDPSQLQFFGNKPYVDLDTSPLPRDNLKFDAWFIAGYHHTHTDLALAALKQNAYAVVEKPLATNSYQYSNFLAAVELDTPSRFFLCFHKRYSELHDLVIKDVIQNSQDAIDMHCVVYEIPLPTLHWYNWPNSGSRLISNGCHWIDYFMFINNYAKVSDYRVWKPRGKDVSVQVKLENSAYFVMSLTDTGSQRLGVREHIELRKGGITASITDAASYAVENRTRVLRKKIVNPMNAYARMYRRIAQTIVAGGEGDSLDSLKSTELTLLLELDVKNYKSYGILSPIQ